MFFRQKRCKHQYKVLNRIITGVTLSWGLKPTRQFTFHSKCKLCGHKKTETGMIFISDREDNPECYDASGWPIDEHGRKLEIAE